MSFIDVIPQGILLKNTFRTVPQLTYTYNGLIIKPVKLILCNL